MQALIRFCALFDLDLDVYRKTINKRKFEEYSKRTGEKRYRYKDDKSDVMLAYYSKNIGGEKKITGGTGGVMHYKFGNTK